MAATNSVFLNAPIPGMSLTSEPGNRPWENPPELVTIEEALEFYVSRLLKAEQEDIDDLLDIIEAGIPIRNLANIMQTSSVMDGRHTLDVGFLVVPAIEEMLMAIADMHNVPFTRSTDDIIKEQRVSRRQARLAAKEALKIEEPEKGPQEVSSEERKGLMGKINKMMES